MYHNFLKGLWYNVFIRKIRKWLQPLDIDIFIDSSFLGCVSLIENAVAGLPHKKHEVEKRMQFPTRTIAVSAWRHTLLVSI